MSNITNLNRDYLIKINVKEATIDVPKMTFWNTDKKTSNMFVQLVINMSENELIKNYVTIENATDYKITLNVIKPKTNQYRTFEAKLLNEEKALFEIDLTSEFIDQVGNYNFEFEVSSKVDNNDESITTSSSTYEVKGSILTNLNQEISSSPDLPILKQLIEQVKSLQGGDLTGYQKKEDETLETTSKKVVGAINEVNSQFKDIANEKFDDITLSDNVLTFFANNKTIKTITLPTSTTGGGTNGKEIELQKSTTHIQWRYVGDTDWTNLVALVDLKGNNGLSAYELAQEQGFGGNVGQWLQSLVPNLQIGTVETLDSGSNATANITGTAQNPLLNLGIPKGENSTGGSNDTLVTTNISGTTLSLTTDKYQTATVVDGTEITLPTVTSFTEIHLFFGTTTDLTLMLPSCKWQNGNTPTISANKTYEFIFTYTTEWLGGVIAYE